MSEPQTFLVSLGNEAATANLMADLALLIGAGDVITLSGDLGAGKTAAARAMIRYLAGDDSLDVPSPTFTLVQSYDLPSFQLLHADLYRINDPRELEELDLSPLPEGVVALIEWPERAGSWLPNAYLLVEIVSVGSDRRSFAFQPVGEIAAWAELKDLLKLLKSKKDPYDSSAARQLG